MSTISLIHFRQYPHNCMRQIKTFKNIFKNKSFQIRNFGQPVAKTHPHLIKEDEVTPGISKLEYCQRRLKLYEELCSTFPTTAKNSIVIIPSAIRRYMTRDVPYPFRQNTDFLYLTGFQEPDSCLIMDGPSSFLFVPKLDENKERWDGYRSGREKAKTLTAVSESFDNDHLLSFLKSKCSNIDNVFYDYDQENSSFNAVIRPMIENKSIRPIRPIIHQLRVIKSPAELELMETSCKIASEMFIETMKFSNPGINESTIYAKLDFEGRLRGAERLAYPPVVAGYDRANIIHYLNNDRQINNSQLVLVDAGVEYHGYVSDVTRTWPIDGKYTDVQLTLYEALHEVHENCLKICDTSITLEQLYIFMLNELCKQLNRLGFIKNNNQIDSIKKTREFCPHHVGHFLGMDVHDTHTIPKDMLLQENMVITVEPGIYITNEMQVPDYFKNIGIRIEDDILITKTGYKNLTANCPKNAKQIEVLINQCN